jgi:N-succinyldiaminopimelate aminotransferase
MGAVRTPLSTKLEPFGTTIFSEMTRLALAHGAINLAQGFPDFDGPPEIIEAAVEALRGGDNQYARSQGHPRLVRALSKRYEDLYGLHFDAMTEIGVFSGCTEAIASAMLGMLNPGDEVILFEPYYDSYPVCVTMAGAKARFCTLRAPDFAFEPAAFEALITPRTRLVLLNTPHNPTGKVFTRDELLAFGEICARHDLLVIADEVYEHLTYDEHVHVPLASIPGLKDRTLTLSSAGKTFSLTGWKIGWSAGPAPMVAAAQAAHQFVTFATATPLQVGVAAALERLDPDFYVRLRAEYTERRRTLVDTLRDTGFRVRAPQGTYFVLCEFGDLFTGDDRAFTRHLVEHIGIAAIPPSVFYGDSDDGRRLVRFAFCKRPETLAEAARRLEKLRPAGGGAAS